MKNDFYQQFIRKAPFGIAHHEIIPDDAGMPSDYRFLEVNEAFEKLTGLKKEELIGRTLRETIQLSEKTGSDWLSLYSIAAKERLASSFDYHSQETGKWYHVQVISENEGFLSATFTDVTVLREKLDLLSEKAGMLQNITDNMFDMVAMCDPEGFFTYHGPTQHILGYAPDELLGTSVFDYIHPDDLASVLDIFREEMSNLVPGRVRSAEYRYRCADGSYVWLETRGKALPGENNKPMALFMSSRDISRRRLAEAKLKENESNLEDIFQSVSEGICYSSSQGVVIAVNDALVEMTGIQRENIVGKNILDLAGEFLSPESAERNRLFIKQLMNEEEVKPVEVEINDKVIEVTAYINKETKRLTGVLRNITKRKRAEEALLKSEELNRLLLTTIPDIVLRSDLNGTITFVNEPGLKNYPGITAESLIGKSMFSFIAEKDKQRNLENTRLMFEKPLGIQEYTIQLSETFFIDCEVNGDVIRDAENQPTGMVFVIRDISERKKAAEALKESEEKHRTLIEQMHEGLIVDYLDGVIHFVNPMLCKMTGYAEHELLGNSGYELLLKPEDMLIMKKRDENRRKHISEQYEMEIITKSGEIRTFWFHAVPVRDKNGEVTGSMSTVIDVTEQKRAEANIRVTRDTYQSIFNSVSEAIYVLDDSNTFIDVNRGAENMYGFSREELIGKNPEKVSAPGMNDLQAVGKIHEEVSETGISQRFEFWGQRKNGEIFPKEVMINKGSYFGKGCIIATARDITERKMAEDALFKESKLQDALMKIASKYINIPLQTVEPAIQDSLEEIGRFVNADRVYIFDYLWAKGICKNTYEWCAEGIEPQIDELQDVPLEMIEWWVDLHAKGETLYIKDVSALDEKDGVRLILEPQGVKSLIAIPMMREKHCVGFVGFDSVKNHHDYSEGDIRLLKVFANMLVNIGLRQEVEQNLVVAKNKAEAGNRLKSAFLNNISHEIRTPLNGILGFGQIITQTGLTQTEKFEYFNILNASISRLMNTITNYIDISLIVSGSLTVNKGLFSPNELLKSLSHHFKPECEARNLALNLNTSEDFKTLKLLSDPELLRKALQHIMNNAVQFTQKGSIDIRAGIHESHVYIAVSDTGVGMEQAFLDKVFDIFVQEDMSLTRQYEGSGLGISITKGFIDILGGGISVESQKGKGTTVKISLPYLPQHDLLIEKPEPEAKKHPVKSPLVLIAEDEITNFIYLEVLLTRNGIRTLHAKNGFEAVELCKKHPEINLVLMDIKMPVMDGLEATRQIKAFRQDLPIIAITAYAQTGDEFRIRQAGCDDYLAKPVKRAVLEKRLQMNGLLQ